MKARATLALGALGAVAFGVWAVARVGPGPTAGSPAPRPRASASSAPATAPSPTAASRRNVFRFADEDPAESAGPQAPGAQRRVAPEPPPPTPEPGPRLVGVVRRGDRVVAALTADGEVELAGPGESAAGVVVLAIDGDSVRIRRPDGTEATLSPP